MEVDLEIGIHIVSGDLLTSNLINNAVPKGIFNINFFCKLNTEILGQPSWTFRELDLDKVIENG